MGKLSRISKLYRRRQHSMGLGQRPSTLHFVPRSVQSVLSCRPKLLFGPEVLIKRTVFLHAVPYLLFCVLLPITQQTKIYLVGKVMLISLG